MIVETLECPECDHGTLGLDCIPGTYGRAGGIVCGSCGAQWDGDGERVRIDDEGDQNR